MSEPIIELRGLSKQFGAIHAVENLDLTVCRGDIYGFLGPNGAGKSTTIRMMLSLIRPSSGSITILGKSLAEHRAAILRRVGAIVEKPDFYLYLSARKNLEILGKLSGADISRRNIESALDHVGLGGRADSKVKTFSYGMKQRLGIAQALLHDPELVILDEPVNGLDPQGVREIRELILELAHGRGKTVFLSSHHLPEVEMIANRMAIIAGGKAVVEGTVSQLLNEGMLKVSIETDEPERARAILTQTGFLPAGETVGNSVVFSMEKSGIPRAVSLIAGAGVAVFGVNSTRSLEEYFIAITGTAA